MSRLSSILLILLALSLSQTALAITYKLPSNGDSVVGRTYTVYAGTGDTFASMVDKYNTGFYELAEANRHLRPELSYRNPKVVLPTKYVLPNTSKRGIVINLAELRLYYYPPNGGKVITYPIGIGKIGWQTPTGNTRVIKKKANPSWKVPKSIQKHVKKTRGIALPDEMPAGDDNPLGRHALYLGIPGYLIHGTNSPYGVGMRISSGCIRLLPRNIQHLYRIVGVGTPVRIINQPYKIGWKNNKMYLEAHQPLSENNTYRINYSKLRNLINRHNKQGVKVNWNRVKRVAQEQNGIPQLISM